MMQQLEYRMEEIALKDGTPDADQIVDRLNAFGKQGWRVSSIDLTSHPSFAKRHVVVLLERAPVAAPVETRQPAAVAGA
jgi:hypothetical protein